MGFTPASSAGRCRSLYKDELFILCAMPMCAYGQRLYDEWSKYGRLIKALDARRSIPMMANVAPDVPFDLDYDETVQQSIDAQEAFLGHQRYCSECSGSWGRPAGCDFRPSE